MAHAFGYIAIVHLFLSTICYRRRTQQDTVITNTPVEFSDHCSISFMSHYPP